MNAYKLIQYFIIILFVMTLITDDVDAVRRRRRRRRFRGREGTRRGPRRIRHAGAKRRMEFVRRRLAKFKARNGDYEGKLRLVDGRAEWEGE